MSYISLTFKVGSSSVAPHVNWASIIQEPKVPNAVIDEEEDQSQNLENNVPNQENIKRSQRVRKSAIPDDYEIYTSEDLGEASYVLGIEIHQDRRKGVLGLSQKSYIEKVLKKFNMRKCTLTPAPIVKDVKFEKF
jgi:hypothetical protein